LIRQAEHTGRRVEVVRDFFHRPAGYPFDCPFRAVPRSDCVGVAGVARVVEMHQLLKVTDSSNSIPIVITIFPSLFTRIS
jgi:hypothetical protein